MTTRTPNFMIIGAMKAGTTTLHEQLARQEGVFMSTPKEPNFFSDDDQWEKGLEWYQSLFADAGDALFIGESSTHYTKLPTHPHTVARLKSTIPPPIKFIYVTRDPVERLISHYIHEWTTGKITEPVEVAVEKYPELIAYSEYEKQVQPFREAFGEDAVKVVRFEDMKRDPDVFFEEIKSFLNAPETWQWKHDLPAQNVSSVRLKKTPLLEFVQKSPTLKFLRRRLLSEKFRERLKSPYRMNERPDLGDAREHLEKLFQS
ncbi:MAG: sulfotransferase [Pseudomonadota bacterium]